MLWCQSKTNMICWIQFWSGTDVVQFEKMVRYWMHSENVELTFWVSQFLNFKSSISQNFLIFFWQELVGRGRPWCWVDQAAGYHFLIFLSFWNVGSNFSISIILTAACNRQWVSTDFNRYVHKLSMKKNLVKLADDSDDLHIAKEIHINCDDFHQQHGSTFADGNNQLTTTLGSRLWAKRSRSTTWRCRDVYDNAGKQWLLIIIVLVIIWRFEHRYEVDLSMIWSYDLSRDSLKSRQDPQT